MNRITTELVYRRALANASTHEAVDLCEAHDAVHGAYGDKTADAGPAFANATIESPDFFRAADAPVGGSIIGGGRVLKDVRGMGRIYDWRASPWTPSNGGKIKPLVFVQHIPVVPNMAGIADFVRLRDVLVAQGLMVQNATDREGNIALYTPMNVLCYQARGANQFSVGTEHMHMSLGEVWSKQQLRASAWLVNQALEKFSIPTTWGDLGNGSGVVRVQNRGQVTHQRVSAAAGYNDRTDPGSGYDREYVTHCVHFYREQLAKTGEGHFEGA